MNHESCTGPVNIGNPAELTIAELARKIIRLTNSQSQLTYKPLLENDPVSRKPDVTLANNTLNWRATTSLDDGLGKTIAYFKRLSAQNPELVSS